MKNLSEYVKYLNNDKRQKLGWRSAFEVDYGRKSNELVKCGIPVNRENESKEFVHERQRRINEEREKVKSAN